MDQLRSAMMAKDMTEQSTIGHINQPPDLINSNTF
jgi:hypothetical protein